MGVIATNDEEADSLRSGLLRAIGDFGANSPVFAADAAENTNGLTGWRRGRDSNPGYSF